MKSRISSSKGTSPVTRNALKKGHLRKTSYTSCRVDSLDWMSDGSRSVTKETSRSVLKGSTRSVPKEQSRSVPKEPTRSVPKEPSRSVPEEPTRLVPKEPSRSVPEEPTRSVPKEPSTSVPKELSRSVHPSNFRSLVLKVLLLCLTKRTMCHGHLIFSGDANREITVTETFYLQTDDELSDKELKQIEDDDQAIQTILLDLLEDIYADEKKAKLFKESEKFTSNEEDRLSLTIIPEWCQHVTIVHQTKDLHTTDYTQLYDFLKYNQKEMVGGNGGNQFRQYAEQNAENPDGYNDVIRNQNQIGNGNLVAAHAEGNAAEQNGNQIRCYNCKGVADLAEIKEVNSNCILMANLQQASTSGTQTDRAPVYDSDGSAEVHNYENCYDNEIFNMYTQEEQYAELLKPIPESHQEAAKFVGEFKSLANKGDASLAKHKALELEIERLLKAVVSRDIMIIVQNESVVDTSDLQTVLEHKISYDKAYKDMQQEIERLQAQLGDLKGKSKDTSCVSDTRNPLSQKLENENVEVEFQVKENQEKDKNQIKTEQKREAWRSWEKIKAVAVERGRKNKENKKRMVENAYTYQKLCNFKEKKKRKGPKVKFFQSSNTRA
nr:hypothetical protein [Tanacetum cinerariifolium]